MSTVTAQRKGVVLVLGILSAFFALTPVASAQTAADAVRNVQNRTDVAGLAPCSSSVAPGSLSPSIPVFGVSIPIPFISAPNQPGTCGETAKSSGRLQWFPAVTYTTGDIIKCVITPTVRLESNFYCTVTHRDMNFTAYAWSGTVAGFGDSQPEVGRYDSNGNLIPGTGREISEAEEDVAQEAAAAQTDGVPACGPGGLLTAPWNFFECGMRAIAWVLLGFVSLLLYLFGLLLNLVIVRTVFEFSTLVGNSEGLLMAWGVLRDLGNMLLLFGFIFIGIAMILNLHSYPAKKTLPRLIIFAILMNFSLFAAEAVIDVSNGLSVTFYNQASVDRECLGEDASNGRSVADCATSGGIAGQIMQASGIASLYGFGPEGSELGAQGGSDVSISTTAYFGLILLATISAMVIFAAAIMLVFRAIVLIILMVTAPIGFAALAIPPLEKLGKEWWHKLLSQSFFAPVLLLFILISLKISEGFAEDGMGSLAGALSQGEAGTAGVLLVFAIVTGFLIASLAAAKQFGAAGATFAVNTGAKLTFGGLTRGTNLVVGGSAAGIGYGIKRATRNADLNKNRWARAGRFMVTRGFEPLSKANLDTRRVGAGALLGAAGATAGAKPEEHASFRDMQHRYQDFRDGKESRVRNAEYDKDVSVIRLASELKELAKGGRADLSPESERFLAGLSADEIAANHDLQHSMETVASRLSSDQFEGVMKSDKIDAKVKDDLAEARFSEVREAVEAGYSRKDTVRNLTNKDLELLAKHNAGTFNKLLTQYDPATGDSMLSGDQTDTLFKNNSLMASQRATLRANTRGARVNNAIKGGNTAQATTYARGMAPKAKAKLDAASLTHKAVIDTFKPEDLAEIQREQKLDSAQIAKVMAEVKKSSHPNSAQIRKWINAKAERQAYWR